MQNTTIANIRGASAASLNLGTDPVFYIIDDGQEGIFEYDSSDTSSADNTGTILTTNDVPSSAKARLKRKFDDVISAKWFDTIHDAITETPTGKTLLIPKGIYLIASQLTINKEIHIIADGDAVIQESSVLGVPMIKLTGAHKSTINGLRCQGAETLGSFAGSSTLFNAFIMAESCNYLTVSNCFITGKSYGVIYKDCTYSKVLNQTFEGFLIAPKANSNFASTVSIEGGTKNQVWGCIGKDTGSGVLVQSDGLNHMISECIFSNCQDNGIYISSGLGCNISMVQIHTSTGMGVKVRGSKHIVSQCMVYNCLVGYSLTGNGITTDIYGANGYGIICQGNIAENCTTDGIVLGPQDGFYGRNFKMLDNFLINCASSGGGYAGVRGGGNYHSIKGNTIINTDGSYAIIMAGTADSVIKGLNISDNDITDAAEGIRVQYTTQSTISNNKFKDITGIGIQMRFCSDNDVERNVAINGAIGSVVSATVTYTNGGNRFMFNKGLTFLIDQTKNKAIGNIPETSNNTSGTTANRPVTDHYVGKTFFDTTLGKPLTIKTAGINELATLQITAAATTSSNLTITLNAIAITVAILAGDTIIQVADKIRFKFIAGWVVSGTDGTDTITFTSVDVGNKTDASFSGGSTGVTGTMTTTTQGTSATWVDSTGTTV